jgi:hypothetical protein
VTGEIAMPKLVRLYIVSVAIGFAAAALFVALLLALDVAGLRGLIFASDAGALALAMLVFFHGIVFAGVQFGIAVMRLAEPVHRGPRGPLRPIPVTVVAGKGGGNRSNRGGVSFPRA